MSDIVFVPKYKISYTVLSVITMLLNMMTFSMCLYSFSRSYDTYLSDTATIWALIIISFGLCIISFLGGFLIRIRELKISGDTMTVSTRIGIKRNMPYTPYIYYEQGKFIINGYVFYNKSFENEYELDWMFYNLALAGKVNYFREKDVRFYRILSRKSIIKNVVLTLVFAGLFIGISVAAVNLTLITNPLIITALLLTPFPLIVFGILSKLPEADIKLWQQILDLF